MEFPSRAILSSASVFLTKGNTVMFDGCRAFVTPTLREIPWRDQEMMIGGRSRQTDSPRIVALHKVKNQVGVRWLAIAGSPATTLGTSFSASSMPPTNSGCGQCTRWLVLVIPTGARVPTGCRGSRDLRRRRCGAFGLVSRHVSAAPNASCAGTS